MELFSPHDVLTVNEIFCREDYPCPREAKVVVDVGSNIGISALYFLSCAPASFVYCFEPDPRNRSRLHANLNDFTHRFRLSDEAVGPFAGLVEFGIESSGRYGGIGIAGEQKIKVRCRHVNDVLAEVIQAHRTVDLLKLDIEGLEAETLQAVEPDLLSRIRSICIEAPADEGADLDGFTHRFRFDTHVYSRMG